MSMGLGLLILLVPLQIVLGDAHGLNTLEHQPVKVAAMEGLWETQARAPAVLFAIPDAASESNALEVAIPGLASVYLKHDVDGVVPGLKGFPVADQPPVALVFFAFRIMVGVGVVMLAVALWGLWLRFRRRMYESPLFLKVCLWMLPSGFIAVVAGWTVTEVGRQPWVVYRMMRTFHAATPSLTGLDVILSLLLYVAVYVPVFGAGLFYLVRLAKAGPPHDVELRDATMSERPARPLSAAGL